MSSSQVWLVLGTCVLTYLVHSTALFALVWTLERAGKLRSLGVREALWRVVLFGALATTAWPLVTRSEPWLGRVGVPIVDSTRDELQTSRSRPRDPIATTTPAIGERTALDASSVPAFLAERETGLVPAGLDESIVTPGVLLSSPRFDLASWIAPAIALALVLAGLLPRIRLRLWLGKRVPIEAGRLYDDLARLRRAAGVRRRIRLTASSRIASPIAFGILHPEICMPVRALDPALDPDLARAMLAHELAHLARLDPLWLALGELAGRLLVFQPLARAAQRRLVHVAELACDRAAVRLTGDSLALARALAGGATWLQPGRPRALCAMARARSRLEERVQCLLASRHERERGGMRWLAAAVVSACAALALPALALERAGARHETTGVASLHAEHAALQQSIAELARQIELLPRDMLLPEEQAWLDALNARASRLVRLAEAIEIRIAEHASRAPDENTRH